MSLDCLDAIIQLRRSLVRAAGAVFDGHLTPRQVALLRELRAAGPLTQVCLARATANDPSTIVRLLDDLEERGFVRRRRSETDRRAMTVSLTASGRKALGPLDESWRRLAHAAAGGLTAEERRVFVGLAHRIVGSLAEAAERAAATPEDLDAR
jgi:DNA-binding MarR family transcriptional regulator